MDRTLHIFMTDPHLSGGGQVTYVDRLAGELVRKGHRVVIGCKPDSVLVEVSAKTGAEALNQFVFKGGLRPRAWLHDLRKIRHYIRKQKPDIIHVSGSQDHWVCALGNQSLGHPVCLVRTRHNTYPVKDNWPNRVLNRRWTDYSIVVCDTVRQTLAAQKTFDGARMCSIHNGVDPAHYMPDSMGRGSARAEFGYGEDHIVCGIAARLVPAKGHEFLFKAIAQLTKDFPNLRVLVLGQGDLKVELQKLAGDLGIANIVQFAGFRTDIPRCTQAFDIGVLPSIDCDTSSFSLKEEMAAEKPIVASDHGGLPEIVNNGIEGFVVPAGSVEPLAEALRRLIVNPDLRRQMGVAGAKRVAKEFSVTVFAQRTLDAYHRALELHREHSAH